MAHNQTPNVATVENAVEPRQINPFENEPTRRKFVLKVYTVLCVCISVTVFHMSLVLYCAAFRNFIFQNQLVFMVVVILTYIITSLALSCCMSMLRNLIVGIVALVVIVESLSIICTITTMYYETQIIFVAAIGTALLTYSLTILAIFMPIDLTKCVFVLAVLGVLFTIFILISATVIFIKYMPVLQLMIAFVGIFVFAVYMLFVTQLIIGGKIHKFGENDFLPAVILLHVYVIIIFLNFIFIFDYLCQ